ncbi:unnamed protein product [Brassica napus]|uniref:(rape) hypothetical protein n=1 Tax=Brassica napus TaxID=3708 RepID=A0A816RCF6_BRANA|nr:unnamed protein product [Brassica napus]
MKCIAAAVSGRGGDPRVVRSCRVIKSGFVGVERSALNVVSLEVEIIVRPRLSCGIVFVCLNCPSVNLNCLFMGFSYRESAYVSDLCILSLN